MIRNACLVLALCLGLPIGGAGAHPHVFVDVGLRFESDGKGNLTGVGTEMGRDCLSAVGPCLTGGSVHPLGCWGLGFVMGEAIGSGIEHRLGARPACARVEKRRLVERWNRRSKFA